MTGDPQVALVLRMAPEFCPLPWPREVSWGRNSWVSEYGRPSHRSLGSGRKRKVKSILCAEPYPTSGQAGYIFILCMNVCVYVCVCICVRASTSACTCRSQRSVSDVAQGTSALLL